jgi:hypothetical protein
VRGARSPGRALVLLVLAPWPAAATAVYFGPWISLGPGDGRLSVLPNRPPAAVSVNAPGLLLTVADPGDAGLRGAVPGFIAAARRSGWKAGLRVSLAAARVPTDPRAAEAASADSLVPGLGSLLRASSGADLFVLELPALAGDVRAPTFAFRRVAAEIHALWPKARVAALIGAMEAGRGLSTGEKAFLTEETRAYIDLVGLRPEEQSAPEEVRRAVDELALGKPLFVDTGRATTPGELLDRAARFAAAGAVCTAAAADFPPSGDDTLLRMGRLLDGDFGADTRPAEARAGDGTPLRVSRFLSSLDLGGVVLVSGVTGAANAWSGPIVLSLDAAGYASAEIVELGTGRSKRLDLPQRTGRTALSLSTAGGPIALRLVPAERTPELTARAAEGVEEKRKPTANEIVARHQAWRAARDRRWTRFIARNETSIQFRFADLNSTLSLTLAGPFFYEKGRGSDWVWHEAYFNGVRWRGKKVPELPLVQPEKVTELPLALTFDDSYRYDLDGEETVQGRPCWVLSFTPKASVSERPLYAGRVDISKDDYSVVRIRSKQLNLTGEMQSVDQESEFGPVSATDGGEPLLFPTLQTSRWILNTFSGTTTLETTTRLVDVRIDPADWDRELAAAYASTDVMVRDTEKGMRYLDRTKEGGRVVVENPKTSRLFGLAGVYWDSSFSYPLPLLGVYYVDLDFLHRQDQLQVFLGGPILLASFSEPRLFGTTLSLGGNVFAVAFRGSNFWYVNGVEDPAQRIKNRSSAANLNLGVPLVRHVKLSMTAGLTYSDYGPGPDTSPDFAIPTDGGTLRLEADVYWDVAGWTLSGSYGWFRRNRWGPWGYPGNPEYDPGKNEFSLYSATVARDFPLPAFRLIRVGASWLGSSNTDRFSEYTFGTFGGTPLTGFSTGNLRAQQAIVVRGAYGYVFGNTFRLLGSYEQAWVTDEYAGYDRVPFAGAGITAEMPGPWSTIIRLDAGIPVVGRNHGATGGVVNLTFLKLF